MKIILVILILFSTAFSKDMYIFYPFTTNQDSLSMTLKSKFPEHTISIFGKYSTLSKQISLNPPDILISNPIIIEKYDSLFNNQLHGHRDTLKFEDYCLISFNEKYLNNRYLQNIKLGSVSYGNRADTKYLVETLLSQSGISVKRVTKTEDLISLLRFNIIDCALVKKSECIKLKSYTKQNIFMRKIINKNIPIISIGLTERSNVKAFIKSIEDINIYFGVNSWKK